MPLLRNIKLILLALFCFFISESFAQYNTNVLPKPAQFDCGDGRIFFNQILYGAVPNNSSNKPVVVYIHGYMDNGYGWFFQENKMYQKSYVNGYRTAFLGHPRTAGIYENGVTISAMIAQVAAYYNTNELVVVAHSKGGLDTEMAMIEYGANQHVKAVITLSTPFQGVPVSDLYGFPILTPIINAFPYFGYLLKQEGTSNLQTGYIQGVIRPYLDNHPNNEPEKFITLGGKGKNHRPNFPNWVVQDIPHIVLYNSPICIQLPIGNANELLIKAFFGASGLVTDGLPTSIYTHGGNGQNDGLVPYYSSIRPGSYEYLSHTSHQSNFNHGEFLYSTAMWRYVQPILSNLDNILAANSRVSEQEIKKDFTETYSTSTQIISKEYGASFSVNDAESKLVLISSDENISISNYEFSPEVRNEAAGKFEINDLKKGIAYSVSSEDDFVGFLQDDGVKIKAQFDFDAPKTFNLQKENPSKIKLQLPIHLMEEVYVEMVQTLNLKGEEVERVSLKLPMVANGTQEFQLSHWPSNLEEGIYQVKIVAKGNGRNSVLITSIVIKSIAANQTNLAKVGEPIIYPNPVQSNLQLTNLKASSVIKIFNAEGQLVKSLSTNDAQHTIDVGNLTNGVYWINIQNGIENTVKQFIKQ